MARLALFAAALLAAAAPTAAREAVPHVEGAWVRLPAVSGRPAGGYFVVHGTRAADALVGVSTPQAQRVELHSVVNEGGVMKMRAEPSFALPAGGELRFQPGGSHLMIFGLSPQVKPGTKLPLTFSFRSGAKVTVEAETRAAGDMPAKPAGDAAKPAGGHQH